MTRHLLLALILLGALLGSTAVTSAEDEPTPPAPPAALPALFLPLVSIGGGAPDLTIAGIEITQSVQTATNSVPLVAGRPAVARIYAVSDAEEPVAGVTVTLAATRAGAPLPGSPLRVGPKGVGRTAARGDYGASFNVLLPQEWLSGSVTLVATVDAERAVAEPNEANNSARASLSFAEVPPLEIVLVPVRYTHTPSGRTYPPPARDTVSDWVMRSYPASAVRVSFHAPLDYAGDLSGGQGWEGLLERVTDLKLADGAPVRQVYYALVPTQGAEPWFYGGVAGIGWVGLRAATSLEFGPGLEDKTGRIAAHEIGHNLRRYHAPCGTSGDARQPFPYDGASIGAQVYGLDIAAGRVWPPESSRDVMSYCTPQWISDFTYTALYSEQRLIGAAATGDGLLVRAELDAAGGVSLLPAYALAGAAITPAGGEYAVELLDAAGAPLARHTVGAALAEAPGVLDAPGGAGEASAPMRRISAVVPLPSAPVAAVRIVRAGAVLAAQTLRLATKDTAGTESRSASFARPSVSSVAGNVLTLRWSPADAPALVRYTHDGARWTTLGIDVVGGALDVDLAALPGGAGRFEVTPAGGASVAVALPKSAGAQRDRAPAAWISGPAEVRAGEPALLYGHAADPEDGALDGLAWEIDGAPAGAGAVLPLSALAPGGHTITLSAADSAGQRAVAALTIVARP